MSNDDPNVNEALRAIIASIIILTLLACAPAVVIAVWRALL